MSYNVKLESGKERGKKGMWKERVKERVKKRGKKSGKERVSSPHHAQFERAHALAHSSASVPSNVATISSL